MPSCEWHRESPKDADEISRGLPSQMGCRSASAFASASFVSKVSAYIAAAEALYPILFEPFDANDENAAFPIVAPLRAPFIMALRNTKKVAGRSSKRGKKMPALDELHDIGLPVDLVAAMFAEFHEELFAFTVAQPLDISPRKQRKPVKFGSDEAKANKARLQYFNKASDPVQLPQFSCLPTPHGCRNYRRSWRPSQETTPNSRGQVHYCVFVRYDSFLADRLRGHYPFRCHLVTRCLCYVQVGQTSGSSKRSSWARAQRFCIA
jgi:hypothetical protein